MDDKYLSAYEGEIILVTGGAGAIGTNLCSALSDAGAKMVIILDDLTSGSVWNIPQRKNIMFVEGSVTDDICLKRVFFERPSYVFHLAAFFANQNSIDYPEKDLHINGLGTLKTLEYSLFNNVKKYVYASSGCSIYGSTAPLPLTEEYMSLHLSTPYQITKMLGELYCNFFIHHYDLKIVKTRFFNSFGSSGLCQSAITVYTSSIGGLSPKGVAKFFGSHSAHSPLRHCPLALMQIV